MDPNDGGGRGGIFRYLSHLDNLVFEIYSEFIVRSSHVMTDALGEEGAEKAFWQEWDHVGYAVPLNIIREMGLTDKGFLVAGYCNNWADTLLGERQVTEVTALGTRARVHSCPLSKASFAVCAGHLQVSVPRLCQLLAPGHEAISRRFLTKGDDCCEILIKSETADPDDLWRAPVLASILPPPLSAEEKLLWSHSYFSAMWIMHVKAMMEALGSEQTLQLLRPAIRRTGIEMAPRIKKELNIVEDEPGSVANALSSLFDAFLMSGALIDSNAKDIRRRTTSCPMSGEPIEVCALFQSFFDGLVSTLSTNMRLEYTERMGEGREDCQWSLHFKREEPKREIDGSTPDPYAALSLRYVNGEISDEEYERKMAMLRRHHPKT